MKPMKEWSKLETATFLFGIVAIGCFVFALLYAEFL